jgi:recombinational DNA repair ATPase RecF
MRIKSIQLKWFRGAADTVLLEADCKSMVAYGENGTGKSCFVDAVEYILNNGRIGHLAHEYSGKHQEKAIPNTHKPPGQKTEFSIKFKDGPELHVEIEPDGSSIRSGADAGAMSTWEYRRTVLRQDEVAEFIGATKGDKYSALLPLLGLQQMEVSAENLRQLAKAVDQQAKLREIRATLREMGRKRHMTFGTDNDDQIIKTIEDLHSRYCSAKDGAQDPLSCCNELKTAIDTRIEEFDADRMRYLALKGAAKLALKDHVDAVRVANAKLANVAEPLIAEKLEVLQSTGAFVEKLGDEKEVKCPACGQPVPVETFQLHVNSERERLQEIIDTFESRKDAIGILSDTVKSLKSSLSKADVKSWRDKLSKGTYHDNILHLDVINAEALRASHTEDDLIAIEGKLLPLIDEATVASKDTPPDVQQLSADKQMVEACQEVIKAKDVAASVKRTEALISFITSLEQGVREEIRLQSQTVIGEISTDIQSMWAILHPGEPVEDVCLYIPQNTDKAIDIGLKFHGVNQDSPRLTLSEGYRNSLGLCIFLSMAKREANKDRPLILDDVVVSLDRNHRGMIAELLEKEFSGRQVLVFTHDREWYTELRHQLDSKNWAFKALLPYDTPDIGIRWSHKTMTFDGARAHLNERPDSAGNDARKIIDTELALITERLKVKLPYLRFEKNDKRMAHEFLGRLVVDGRKCFQKKVSGAYVPHPEVISALEEADRLLVSWGNRGSHTFDVVRPEAMKLIDICEKAIECFRCSSCGRNIWFADAEASEWVQCQCGEIRWRYGK